MRAPLTRREFLKLSGAGAASSLLAGCSWAGLETVSTLGAGLDLDEGCLSIATTCGECPGGCGIIVQKHGARLGWLAGNPAHPLYPGNTCPQAQAALSKLGLPQRFNQPVRHLKRRQGGRKSLGWQGAIRAVTKGFQDYRPDEIAFLLGTFPDHLNDLVHRIAGALGGASVLRYSPQAEFEGRIALMDAAQRLFGVPRIPCFDVRRADLVFSFGTSLSESWLFPPGGCGADNPLQSGLEGLGRKVVFFDVHPPNVRSGAWEWIPVRPGGLATLAMAFVGLIQNDGVDLSASRVLERTAQETGVPVQDILRLAGLFQQSERRIALPGSCALNGPEGSSAGEAILALNALAGNLGKEGGLFFAPEAALYPELPSRPSTAAEMGALVARMRSGQIKALFVHGVDPLSGLPASFGFEQALERVEHVFSFAALPNYFSTLADYVLPTPLSLESWGYQRSLPGSDRPIVSALQPVLAPPSGVRSMADILLSALELLGGGLSDVVGFHSELDFVRKSVLRLVERSSFGSEANAESVWQRWRHNGGWWSDQPVLAPPVLLADIQRLSSAPMGAQFGPLDNPDEPDWFTLHLDPILAWSGVWGLLPVVAGLPRVEMHPRSAGVLGLRGGQTIHVKTPAGELRAMLSLNPSLQSDALVVAWDPRFQWNSEPSSGPGVAPLDLLGADQNAAGGLVCQGVRAKVIPAV